MSEIELEFDAISEIKSVFCAILAGYTFISILDHERWMNEWGDDHEAVAVWHLRIPILSAAIAMGIGGIATVDVISAASIDVDGQELQTSVLFALLAAVMGVVCVFAMVFVARKDVFAGVDRVQRLKDVILEQHTLAEIKRLKGLGKKAAYFAKLRYVLISGVILAVGVFGSWALNAGGISGEFVVVWKAWNVTILAVAVLLWCVFVCWMLFRVLVWRPSHEELRPLCSVLVAFSLWSMNFFGKRFALGFEYLNGRTPRDSLGWVLKRSPNYGDWLLIFLSVGAVFTQYAIALELRLAYCGLQDANLDLQMIVGSTAPDEQTARKTGAITSSMRRGTGQGPRSPPARSRRRASAALAHTPPAPLSPSLTLALTPTQVKAPPSVIGAILRFSSVTHDHNGSSRPQLRSIRVQPTTGSKVYQTSVAEDDEGEDEELSGEKASTRSAGWDVVRPKTSAALKALEVPAGLP